MPTKVHSPTKQQAATPALAAATAVTNYKRTALDFCCSSADSSRNVRAQQKNCSRNTRADDRQDQRVFRRSGARFIPQIRSNELFHNKPHLLPRSTLKRSFENAYGQGCTTQPCENLLATLGVCKGQFDVNLLGRPNKLRQWLNHNTVTIIFLAPRRGIEQSSQSRRGEICRDRTH